MFCFLTKSFAYFLHQENEETIKICTYIYEKEGIETEAKSVDVKYTKACDTQYVSICKPKPSYHKPSYQPSYYEPKESCKEAPQEVCYNTPQVSRIKY